jgi:hypothetical protein
MAGFDDTHKRRASDLVGAAPTGEPLLDLLRDVLKRLETLEGYCAEIQTAFVQNDLKKPDFDGHRKAHIIMIKAAEVVDGYKQDATKTVLHWLLAGILGLLLTGFGAWVSGHLK